MVCLGIDLLAFILFDILWTPQIFVWLSGINLGDILCHYYLYSFLSSPSDFSLYVFCTFYNHPTDLRYSILSLSIFFSLLFNFGTFCCHIRKLKGSFLSRVCSPEPPKIFFILLQCFWPLAFLSIFLLTLFIYSCMLSTFLPWYP